MKKSMTFLSVLLFVVSGILFTGCKEVIEVFSGPKNTWCEMEVEYKDAVIVVDAIYVEETQYGDGGSYMDEDLKLEPGITFVVRVNSDSDKPVIQNLTSQSYAMKTFPKGKSTTLGGGSEDGESTTPKLTINGNATNWAVLYNAKKDLHQKANQLKLPECPYIISGNAKDDGAKNLTDEDGFPWAELLRDCVLDAVLDKLER